MRPGPHFNSPWLENIAQWPDSLGDAIPTDNVMLNELGHNILGNRGK